MDQKTVVEIGQEFGLTIEPITDDDNVTTYKICKGVNQVFAGTEGEARQFLSTYANERPPLFDGSV